MISREDFLVVIDHYEELTEQRARMVSKLQEEIYDLNRVCDLLSGQNVKLSKKYNALKKKKTGEKKNAKNK